VVIQLDVPSLCAKCGGGRLIGQAVHEHNVGWRYFLACTDCEAKLELDQESVREFAQPRTEAPAAKANGGRHDDDGSAAHLAGAFTAPSLKSEDRKCGQPGCTTILSAYNTTTACWAHTGPSFR